PVRPPAAGRLLGHVEWPDDLEMPGDRPDDGDANLAALIEAYGKRLAERDEIYGHPIFHKVKASNLAAELELCRRLRREIEAKLEAIRAPTPNRNARAKPRRNGSVQEREEHCLEVVRAAGHDLKAPEIMARLGLAGHIHSKSAVKSALSNFVKRGKLIPPGTG